MKSYKRNDIGGCNFSKDKLQKRENFVSIMNYKALQGHPLYLGNHFEIFYKNTIKAVHGLHPKSFYALNMRIAKLRYQERKEIKKTPNQRFASRDTRR